MVASDRPMTSTIRIVLLLVCVGAGHAQKVEDQMTVEELRRVFQVEERHLVPEYELVTPRRLVKREVRLDEAKQIHLSAFGRSLSLTLRPNEDFRRKLDRFKVIEAETTATGLKFHEMSPQENETESIGIPYHDENNMAAVLISERSDGAFSMDGTIGNDLVIKPLPPWPGSTSGGSGGDSSSSASNSETDDSYVDDEMFLDEDDFADFRSRNRTSVSGIRGANSKAANPSVSANKGQRKIPKLTTGHAAPSHVVYKRLPEKDDHHSDFLNMEPGQFSNRSSRVHSADGGSGQGGRRTKRQAPDTVWPEVLLIVDYDTFVLHNGNSHDIKRYFVSFWNGVDLRYKLLTHPTIKISLAGMIVAKDRDATPYLEQNRLRPPNGDAVDAAGALTDLGKYLYREDRLPTYDLAVVITKLDMCRRRFQGGRCNRGTAGFAYVGGACVVNKRLEKVNSVAIIEDSGGFSGIIVAAHEVGHLLGCVHDGSPPPSYLGGPGATRCPWEDGFIMSDLRHTERGFRWSACSVEQFKHFLNGETATCLFNFPHENDLLARVLPGTMMTLDQQCKRDRGTTACFRDQRVCAQLFCFDSSSGYCVSYRPAAEGSPCGDGQVCKNGRCLTELENIIPDYTHVTATFANRPGGSATDPFRRRSDSPHDESNSHQGGSSPSDRDRDHQRDHNNKDNKEVSSSPAPRQSRYSRRPQQAPPPSSSSSSSSTSSSSSSSGASTPQQQRVTAKPSSKQQRGSHQNNSNSNNSCQDTVQKLGGSMSCKEFLEQFGYRYCSYDYVKSNCCASHDVMCKKG